MPTYGYQCPGCGHEFEKFQKINDDTRVNCPKCGAKGERVISGGVGVVFKGSGFYETDYKRAKSEAKTKEGGVDKKTGDEAKPATEKKEKSKSKGDDS